MAPGAHRIGRLVLALDAAEAGDLAQLSAHLQAGLTDRICAALSPVLDGLDPQGDVIRLDRLELDLGRVAADGADLPGKLAAALAQALGLGFADAASASPAMVPAEASKGARPTEPGAAAPAPPEDLLAVFLQTGFLPPPLDGDALAPLCAALLALAPAARDRARLRLRTVLRDEFARQRAVLQLPAGLLLALLDPEDRLRATLQDERIDDPQAVLPAALQARMLAALTGDTRAPVPGAAPSAAMPADGASPPPVPLPAAEIPVPPSAADPLPDLPGRIAVPTAGLVLLAPYLSAYFEALGLATQGRFASPDQQARAVLLTQALATGRGEAMEPDLALPKLLCGRDLTAPVPQQIDLSDAERTEACALLQAVIAHWGALGATTPDGLRDGFLCRPGVLDRLPGGGFRLRVERRGIDILLERLPWTLSMLRTPFMAAPLQVDWR
ncbi:MAG: hypothetical protein KDA50_12300 [Rhodobacteraceae bacterium]|nr:hypothetical protein [Paracoccaceae bacterium]